MVGSCVELMDPQELAHVLHEVGEQVGSPVLRHSKHRHYFFRQKTSKTNGLLDGDREHQRPLEKVLKHHYMLVTSLGLRQVHDVDPHNLKHALHRNGMEWGSVQPSGGVDHSALRTGSAVADHVRVH
jgi:hypothetical protein